MTMVSYKVVAYKEFLPKLLISPRWLAILLEAVLALGGIFVFILITTFFCGRENLVDMIVLASLITIPLFLVAVFYKVRIYSDGTLYVYLCGFKRKIAIKDIKQIRPVSVKTRLHDLTYYDCVLADGKTCRINVADIDNFVAELKLHNDAIVFISGNH